MLSIPLPITAIVFPFAFSVAVCAILSIPFARPLTVTIPFFAISYDNVFATISPYFVCSLQPIIASLN